METWVVATSLIFVYLLITLGVAVVANRHMSVDMEDFLLAGRRTGFVVLYLTVVATFHSAFAFLGSGGFFYTHGIGFWAAGAWTVLVGAITYVIGTRIWALGKTFGYITPADMLADFYESEAVRVAIAAVLGPLHHPLHPGAGPRAGLHRGGRLGRAHLLRGRRVRDARGGGGAPGDRRAAGRLLDRRHAGRVDVRRGLGGGAGALFRAVRGAGRALAGGGGPASRAAHASRTGRPLHAGHLGGDGDHAFLRHRPAAPHDDPLLHGGGWQDAQAAGRDHAPST